MVHDTLEELPHGKALGLLERLRKSWPDNIAIHYTLKMNIDWVERGSEMQLKILLPSCGAHKDESVVLVQDRPTAYRILLHCPEHSEDALLDALFQSTRISWTRGPEFCRIPQRIATKLAGRLKKKNMSYDIDDNVYFWLSAKRALQLPRLSPSDDVELRPLTLNDLNTLCNNYPLLSAGTFSLTKDILSFNKTVGLFRKDIGQLIGWSVHAQWGTIGQLMVLPDQRRRGYAKVVVTHLARLIAEQGWDPYCNISVDNEASLAEEVSGMEGLCGNEAEIGHFKWREVQNYHFVPPILTSFPLCP